MATQPVTDPGYPVYPVASQPAAYLVYRCTEQVDQRRDACDEYQIVQAMLPQSVTAADRDCRHQRSTQPAGG